MRACVCVCVNCHGSINPPKRGDLYLNGGVAQWENIYMINDWVNSGVLTSPKYLTNAVWSEFHFVFGEMPVDIVVNA